MPVDQAPAAAQGGGHGAAAGGGGRSGLLDRRGQSDGAEDQRPAGRRAGLVPGFCALSADLEPRSQPDDPRRLPAKHCRIGCKPGAGDARWGAAERSLRRLGDLHQPASGNHRLGRCRARRRLRPLRGRRAYRRRSDTRLRGRVTARERPWPAALEWGEGGPAGTRARCLALSETLLATLLLVAAESSNGWDPIRAGRGPADTSALPCRDWTASGRFQRDFGRAVAALRLSAYQEDRSAGTLYAGSRERGEQISLTARQADPPPRLVGLAGSGMGPGFDLANTSASVSVNQQTASLSDNESQTPAYGVGLNAAVRPASRPTAGSSASMRATSTAPAMMRSSAWVWPPARGSAAAANGSPGATPRAAARSARCS